MIYDLEERITKFRVEVVTSKDWELVLSVTYDGYSWRTIHLLPAEAERVIAELKKHL